MKDPIVGVEQLEKSNFRALSFDTLPARKHGLARFIAHECVGKRHQVGLGHKATRWFLGSGDHVRIDELVTISREKIRGGKSFDFLHYSAIGHS